MSQEEEPDTTPRIYCFKDAGRECGVDCMAYQVAIPEGPDYVNQNFARCSILTNNYKMAKHLVVLAQQGAAILDHFKIQKADRQREANSPQARIVRG